MLTSVALQLRDAELDLETVQKRRLEDKDDEERFLALLSRIEEDVARLRRTEALARELAEQQNDVDRVIWSSCAPQTSGTRPCHPKQELEAGPVQFRSTGGKHDSWIAELPLKETLSRGGPAGITHWNAFGGPFTCTKPFDGDPRE